MATIKVDVVSAEESIFSGDAELVSLPGKSGELGILPGHVPLITLIRPGFVRIHLPGKKEVEQGQNATGEIEIARLEAEMAALAAQIVAIKKIRQQR